MKLSEMNTKTAAACMAELAVPLAAVAKNTAVKEYCNKAKNNEATVELAVDAFSTLIPVFLRDHYAEVVKVLSILTGKPVKEINAQPIKQTIADAKEVFDGDLVSFFYLIVSFGAGRVLEAIASSSVPLRPSGLALLLKEQTKKNTLQIYAGNIQWSILAALHFLGKNELKIPTYSDVWGEVMDEEPAESKSDRARREIEMVKQRVTDMLNRFS